jgi:hypothetical protein
MRTLSGRHASLALVLVAGAAAFLSGCGSTGTTAQHQAVRGNLTPELLTLSRRPVDSDNIATRGFNYNRRMMADDLSRALLLNRPSRLSMYPKPY